MVDALVIHAFDGSLLMLSSWLATTSVEHRSWLLPQQPSWHGSSAVPGTGIRGLKGVWGLLAEILEVVRLETNSARPDQNGYPNTNPTDPSDPWIGGSPVLRCSFPRYENHRSWVRENIASQRFSKVILELFFCWDYCIFLL